MDLGTDLLAALERYFDEVPRAQSDVEEVGPFTLFRAHPSAGWPFYARPRLGLDRPVAPRDVELLLARQDELGLPRTLEWVEEVAPSLAPAVTAVLGPAAVHRHPLLVLPPGAPLRDDAARACADPPPDASLDASLDVSLDVSLDEAPLHDAVDTVAEDGLVRPAGPSYDVLPGDHPDLGAVAATVAAAFAGTDEVGPPQVGNQPDLVARGLLVVAAAREGDLLVGGGTASPRGGAAELTGIAVLPRARRRGHGRGTTLALARACRAAGADLLLLSAADDGATALYEAVGFARVGTACVLDAGTGGTGGTGG